MKRIISIVVSIMLLVTLFAGCGNNSKPTNDTAASTSAPEKSAADTKAQAADQQKVTLNLSTWVQPYKDFYDQQFKAKLNEKYPNIDVQMDVFPADQYEKVIKTRVLGGDAPDIIELGVGATFNAFAKDGNLKDLSDQEFASKYPDAVKSSISNDGKLYGICLEGNGAGWMYNKAVFDKVGVQPPKNYKELLDVCEKIKAAGITPIGFGAKDAWTLNWFVNPFVSSYAYTSNPKFGADRYDSKTTFAKDFKPIYEKIAELIGKGYTNKGALGMDFGQLEQAIADGKIAMTVNGDWTIGDIARGNAGKNIEIDYFPVTSDDGKVQLIFSPATIFTVYSKSKHMDEAMKYIALQGSAEGSQMFAEFKQCIPGRVDLTGAKLPNGTKTYSADMAKYPVSDQYVYASMPPSAVQVNEKTIQSMIAGEKVDIAKALDDMDKAFDKDKSQVTKPAK